MQPRLSSYVHNAVIFDNIHAREKLSMPMSYSRKCSASRWSSCYTSEHAFLVRLWVNVT